ncbi:SRPBCC family protein [Nocardioides sp. KIGAM211]|uniref:SRPBCC family protein n=1 Tax=Nocardioides luti TaxID=2761101 RepID=A0A7X0VA53_9ACTN|nr:SRPBCC family protein [Nocardioides luti]MBB6627221.1 SRPBCC family protein [Nocardioides luti]
MTTTLHLEQSRAFPASVEQAFDTVLPAPLPEIFHRRYAALPAIREVRDQEGSWGTVGQTRTIVLADGGTMRETLTSVERADHFGYTISDVTGPMKLLVRSLEGRWAFAPAGTGVRITWSWDLEPTSDLADLAMPLFARLWKGYARQALEEIEPLLLR